jgi:hypothetical protein
MSTSKGSRSKVDVDAQSGDLPEASTSMFLFHKRDYVLISLGAVLTILVIAILNFAGISVFNVSSSNNLTGTTFEQQTSGQIALTESELKSVVADLGVPVYWSGPMQGAKYTVSSKDGSQVYIRYLPDGIVPTDNTPDYRVIGTYKLQSAFAATQKAGVSVANGIGFTNGDGAAVYYNKNTPTNVYMAFPETDAQIEIFDPMAGVAIQLATSTGSIQLVK